MRVHRLFLLIVLVAIQPIMLCAAQDDRRLELSVADAIARALEVNANIKQAEAARLTSLSNLKVAGITTAYGIGSLTGLDRTQNESGISSRAYGSLTYRSLVGTEASVDFSPFGLGTERGALSLTLRKPLLAGRGVLSKKADLLAGARIDASIQEKQLYLIRQATVIGVIEAYYRAVLAREQVKVQERSLAIAERAADGAAKRAAAGLIRGIDVSRAEIRVAQTRDQLNLQKQAYNAAKDRLMAVIGAGVGEDLELVDGIPEQVDDLPESLVNAVNIALANRMELAVFDERLEDQKRTLTIAGDQLRPQLDLVARFNSSSDDEGVISGSLINKGSFRTGIEYRFPLDKRISIENKENAARGLDVLEKLKALQMEEITEQVRRAYRGVETAKTTLDILSANVKVAEDNLHFAQRMVEEGIDDNRVLLDAMDSLAQVESGLNSAKVDHYLAMVNLRYAMGQNLLDIGAK